MTPHLILPTSAQVTTAGIITTVAGTGIAGYNADGVVATAAMLNNPYGVALTFQGDIIIADTSNHRMRLVILRC